MNIERLKKLCALNSVSGFEEKMKTFFISENPQAKYLQDRLGSIFYIKKSSNPKAKRLLIACAMDEIGLMVNSINNDGSLGFITLESISPASLLHQKVEIIKRNDEIVNGIIVAKKYKFKEIALDKINLEDLVIDAGFTYEEALKNFKPGDLITFKHDFNHIGYCVVDKSLHQKALIEAIIELIEKLKHQTYDYEIVLGLIAQSTIGWRGSKTANYVVKPDIALILTGFEVNNSQPKININDGIIIGNYDKQMLPNRLLLNDFKAHINTKDYLGMLGNDGSFIHKTLSGVPTISIGIPIANMGSSVEMINTNNIDKLITGLIKYLNILDHQKIINLGVSDDEF